MASEWSKLRAALTDAGYVVEIGRGSTHWKIHRQGDSQCVMTMPCSPGNHRSFINTVAQIRRHLGLDYRPKQTRRRAR